MKVSIRVLRDKKWQVQEFDDVVGWNLDYKTGWLELAREDVVEFFDLDKIDHVVVPRLEQAPPKNEKEQEDS